MTSLRGEHGGRIKVLAIDDSAVVRQAIGSVLSRDASIRMLGTVADPIFALTRMKMEWPDVIVLDIEMPRMDGLTFLRKVMAERPTPVVICSTLTQKGADRTMQALAAGAVAIVAKPRLGVKDFLLDGASDLLRVVKGAAQANMSNVRPAPDATEPRRPESGASARPTPLQETTDRIVAIGTSTGGTQALEAVLSALPRVTAGIVVVQHMPEKFTAAFAQRLDAICELEVREACNGDRVIPGLALIAPGGRHMRVQRSGAQYQVSVEDGPLVNHHRPSVDVLFRSVARCAGKNALGVIMTGMGSDGALGLQAMHEAGARTVAQDESTSVVYGMPKEAIRAGAVDKELPLQAIAGEIQANWKI